MTGTSRTDDREHIDLLKRQIALLKVERDALAECVRALFHLWMAS